MGVARLDFTFRAQRIQNGYTIEIVDDFAHDLSALPIYCEDSEQVIRNFVIKLVPPDEARDILKRAFPGGNK